MAKSLWPREHGAYAQLAAPLVAALIVRRPTLAAGLLAIAATCAFLANEPLLVWLGHRGPRAKRTQGVRARRRWVLLASVAGVAGVLGLALANPPTLLVAAVSLSLAGVLVALAFCRSQHSLAGELFAAVALPMASAPVAAASGMPPGSALALASVWAAGFFASVAAVHRVIDRKRKPASTLDHALVVAILGALLTVVWLPIVLIAIPLLAVAAYLVARPPRAKHLRAIGVALVVASLASVTLTATVA